MASRVPIEKQGERPDKSCWIRPASSPRDVISSGRFLSEVTLIESGLRGNPQETVEADSRPNRDSNVQSDSAKRIRGKGSLSARWSAIWNFGLWGRWLGESFAGSWTNRKLAPLAISGQDIVELGE